MSIRSIKEERFIEFSKEDLLEYVVGERLELECAVRGNQTLEFELQWICLTFERETISESCESLLRGSISNIISYHYN